MQSAAMNRPKLVRKKHVEAEVADSRIISPVFFGKKKNLSKPRREFRFDETLVVWQKIDFSFLYNVLGPATASSSAQYKHGMKMIGQGLALIELSPQHVKSPASAFPSSGASGNNQSQPLILLTGSQLALEEDIVALDEHVRSRESFAMKPYVDPTGSNLPIPIAESGIGSAGSKSSPESLHDGIRTRSVSTNDGTTGKVLPGSCSEIHLRIYPTIPMQTQVLADFCTACLEKALVVYSMERLISACGTGVVSETTTAAASIVRSTVISGPARSEGSDDASDATSAKTTAREKHMLTPENSLLPSPVFSDFLRLCHGTLAAAKLPSAFIGRSNGILRFPAILPRQKAQAVRTQIVDRLLDTYPALRTAAVECACDPLFIPPSSDHGIAGDTGIRDVDSDGSSSHGNVVWCDTSTGSSSSSGTRGTSTLLGLNSLSGGATLSPGSSLSYNGDVYQQNIETLSLPTSTSEPGSYGSTPGSNVSVVGGASSMSRAQSDRISLLNKTGTASSAQHSSHFMRRTPSLATDKKGHDNQALSSASGSVPGPSSSSLTMTTAASGGTVGDLRSLTNSDPTIIGSLPLWLRKRNFSLEICVSTEGVLVFFFNVAPAIVNAICEICANITAAGLRQHNEQLRQQLAMLGVLKASPMPPPNYFPRTFLPSPTPATTAEASNSLPSSPLRISMPSASPTLLSSLTASHSGLFGGSSAAPTVTSSNMLGIAQPTATTVRVIVPSKTEPATDDTTFEWLAKAVNRMCWDKRTLERLQKHHTQTSTPHSYPQVEPLLRIHPRSWRDGVLLSSVVLPLPRTSYELTDRNVGHQNSHKSPFDDYLAVVQELCDVLDFDLLVHNDHEVGSNAPKGGAFVVAPIPRTAVVAVAELSCVVHGICSSGSNDQEVADITDHGVIITVRMMDIVDIIKVASRIGLMHEKDSNENTSIDSSSSYSSSLVARCRELLVGLPSLSISAEQTLQSFGSSSGGAEGLDDELLDWSVIDNPVVCKLQKNLVLSTFIAFDRSLRPGVNQKDSFYEQHLAKQGDVIDPHRCGGHQLVQSLLAVLGDTMLVENVSFTHPCHELLVSLPSVPEILRCAVGDHSNTLPHDISVLPSGMLCFQILCVDLTGRVVAKGIVLTSVSPDVQEVIVAAYHVHEVAVDTTGDCGDEPLRPLTILLPSNDLPDDGMVLTQIDTAAIKTASSTFSPQFQIVVREACSAATRVIDCATTNALLQRSWTTLRRKNDECFVNADVNHAYELKQLMAFLCSKESPLPLTFLESFREPLVALNGKGDKIIEKMAMRLSRLSSCHQCIYFTEGSTHHIIVVALPSDEIDGVSVVSQLLHVCIQSTNDTALCRLFGDSNSTGDQLIPHVVEILLFSISKAF